MGDRFRLRALRLDTTTIVVGKGCQFTGALVFMVPRRDTFPVTWFGQAGSIAQAGRVIMIGWPVDLGPFSGIEATPWGDSLVGNLLFDGPLGIQVKPGVTAQFVAGRAPPRGPHRLSFAPVLGRCRARSVYRAVRHTAGGDPSPAPQKH